MFYNRHEAGILLSEKCKELNVKADMVVAIPRGGVPVGAALAGQLKIPLEIIMAKKIGHPINREYAIGAVGIDTALIMDPREATREYIQREIARLQEQIGRKTKQYRKGRKPFSLTEKKIILVDDGVATGSTMLASLQMLKKLGARQITLALPVGPPSTLNQLRNMPEVDQVICLLEPDSFLGVGAFYTFFEQLSDDEVSLLLWEANSVKSSGNSGGSKPSDQATFT